MLEHENELILDGRPAGSDRIGSDARLTRIRDGDSDGDKGRTTGHHWRCDRRSGLRSGPIRSNPRRIAQLFLSEDEDA